MTLLERAPLLAQLRDLLEESRKGQGRLILIKGEAGIGKTALVEAFCADAAGDANVLSGSCDVVVPARPFAPLVDIADALRGTLQEALEAVDRSLRRLSGTAPGTSRLAAAGRVRGSALGR